nr:isocitrate lyase/phosphoenolpyruvate mutase family protein [Streptomyces sp. NRRL S-646]
MLRRLCGRPHPVRPRRRGTGEPFVLVGRTDALLVGGTLNECIRRANAYLAAGTDCVFVPGAADAETIGILVRELDGPLKVVMGLNGGTLSLDHLRELGVRRVTLAAASPARCTASC